MRSLFCFRSLACIQKPIWTLTNLTPIKRGHIEGKSSSTSDNRNLRYWLRGTKLPASHPQTLVRCNVMTRTTIINKCNDNNNKQQQ